MSEVRFFQTRVGRRFYESTLPELVNQLSRLNDLLAVIVARQESQDKEPESTKGENRGSP
ncbi:MAG: hypothetical protein ABIF77_16955 [bacterium]